MYDTILSASTPPRRGAVADLTDLDALWAWLATLGYDAPSKLGRALARIELGLTPTQLRIAWLVMQGLGNREIADRLGKGEEAVKSCLSCIYKTLRISNRTQLATRMKAFVPPPGVIINERAGADSPPSGWHPIDRHDSPIR